MSESPTLQRQIVLTGASSGIGKAAVRILAEQGAHVTLVCRDPAKGEAALRELGAHAAQCRVVVGDLGSVAKVRALAKTLLDTCPRIDVLINNAGVWMTEKVINDDGLEMSFMVNHLAPFLLTWLLLDRLEQSRPARIVNVNSGLYINGVLDLAKTPKGDDFGKLKSYANSKFCNMLATRELAKRIEGTGITVNALHPGVIRTNLGATGGALGAVLRVAKLFWKSPESGGQTVAHLALAPELEGVSGRYFDCYKETPIIARAQNDVLGRELWDLSERLAGLG